MQNKNPIGGLHNKMELAKESLILKKDQWNLFRMNNQKNMILKSGYNFRNLWTIF